MSKIKGITDARIETETTTWRKGVCRVTSQEDSSDFGKTCSTICMRSSMKLLGYNSFHAPGIHLNYINMLIFDLTSTSHLSTKTIADNLQTPFVVILVVIFFFDRRVVGDLEDEDAVGDVV